MLLLVGDRGIGIRCIVYAIAYASDPGHQIGREKEAAKRELMCARKFSHVGALSLAGKDCVNDR